LNKTTRFESADMEAFEAEAKVGLLATVNPDGLPHITLITSMQANGPTQLVWGQFCEGLSKVHVKKNPHTGFLIMTLDRNLWRGKALWTHLETEGEAYDMYNQKPMFRYNAYFGIHTVHFMKVVETAARERLPLARIVLGSLATRAAKAGAKAAGKDRILKPWAEGLFNRMDALKFIGYIGHDGFPTLIPLIQCQAAGHRRLAFSPYPYGEDLAALQEGMQVAVFAMSMQMEDVLVRGTFLGYERARFQRIGVIQLEWVYNSMPPVPGQIYPPLELEPVINF
jgi:Pyridoxamine 5'-phosphate oxidase